VSDFSEKYGPWALVAGASDGVGAAFARSVAERGVNVILLARRKALLDEVGERIRADTGVEVRSLSVDLSQDGAVPNILDATRDVEVGLLMYCAGADPNYEHFLNHSVETALAMVHRNCVVPMELCHHFAGQMVGRGRGGIVLVGSGAGLAGAPNMVAYGATKAFDMLMAESLWTEVHDKGVDVLGLILALTDTPALRRLMFKRGELSSPDDTSPIPGAVTAEEAATDAIEYLAKGPTRFVGEMMQTGAQMLGSMDRNDAVKLMIEIGGGVMGSDG